jgi:hypothetical protein
LNIAGEAPDSAFWDQRLALTLSQVLRFHFEATSVIRNFCPEKCDGKRLSKVKNSEGAAAFRLLKSIAGERFAFSPDSPLRIVGAGG